MHYAHLGKTSALALLMSLAVAGCRDDGQPSTPPPPEAASPSLPTPQPALSNALNAGADPATRIDGTDGDDTLNAGSGDDTVIGGDGNDLIMGGDGNDLLIGDSADGYVSPEQAARFLVQASFGGNEAEIREVADLGYTEWIKRQIDLPMDSFVDRIRDHATARDAEGRFIERRDLDDMFWERVLHGDDHLRQRVAFALSEIVVISRNNFAGDQQPRLFSTYMDSLQEHALGNYCDMIQDVSRLPVMAEWLTYMKNEKADPELGFNPDENYARELMQLFTIGLVELNQDGTVRTPQTETYTQDDVAGLAAVFTGLSWDEDRFERGSVNNSNIYLPLKAFPFYHEPGPKTFLGTTINTGTDVEASLTQAIDHINAHPNVAPFISKQLIQKLVTANPEPAYVARVADAFDRGTYQMPDGDIIGTGRRCDMAATISAVLMDDQARDPVVMERSTFGKPREPLLAAAQWLRAFRVEGSLSETGILPDAGFMQTFENADKLSQSPYRSPSVFNYYRPGFVSPGSETAAAGLVSPESQMYSTSSLAAYLQFVRVHATGNRTAEIFQPDYAAFYPDAANVPTLIDRLDRLMTYGTLEDDTRARIEAIVSNITRPTNDPDELARRRMGLAVMLIMTSPEYLTQR